MFKVELDTEQLQTIVESAVAKALENHKSASSLPPILDKSQFMELLNIGPTKAAELLNREDFPVIRDLGHPRVLTHLFIQWCEDHTEWINKNADTSHWKRTG